MSRLFKLIKVDRLAKITWSKKFIKRSNDLKFKWIIVAMIVVAVALTGCGKTDAPPPTQQGQTPPSSEQPKDAGPPLVLEEGVSPEEHVRKYFDAYVAKDFEAAYNLQPAVNKAKQTKDEFTTQRGGFPISDYNVLPVSEQDGQQVVDVEYDLGEQYGIWVSSWMFTKDGSNWVADEFVVSMKQ